MKLNIQSKNMRTFGWSPCASTLNLPFGPQLHFEYFFAHITETYLQSILKTISCVRNLLKALFKTKTKEFQAKKQKYPFTCSSVIYPTKNIGRLSKNNRGYWEPDFGCAEVGRSLRKFTSTFVRAITIVYRSLTNVYVYIVYSFGCRRKDDMAVPRSLSSHTVNKQDKCVEQ